MPRLISDIWIFYMLKSEDSLYCEIVSKYDINVHILAILLIQIKNKKLVCYIHSSSFICIICENQLSNSLLLYWDFIWFKSSNYSLNINILKIIRIYNWLLELYQMLSYKEQLRTMNQTLPQYHMVNYLCNIIYYI